MEQTVTLKIETTTINGKQANLTVDYDPDDIRTLVFALVGDESLREAALLASSYIIASSSDPEGTVNGMMEMVNDILKEESKSNN